MQVGQRIDVEFAEDVDGSGPDYWTETLIVDEVRLDGFDALDADELTHVFRLDDDGYWSTGDWERMGIVIGLASDAAIA